MLYKFELDESKIELIKGLIQMGINKCYSYYDDAVFFNSTSLKNELAQNIDSAEIIYESFLRGGFVDD